MKLWSRWCQKVEEHNSKLDGYVDMEEFWHPCDIFNPAIISVLIAFFTCGLADAFSIKNFMFSFIFSLIAMSLAYFANWKLNEK